MTVKLTQKMGLDVVTALQKLRNYFVTQDDEKHKKTYFGQFIIECYWNYVVTGKIRQYGKCMIFMILIDQSNRFTLTAYRYMMMHYNNHIFLIT